MERSEISSHEVKIFSYLKEHSETWHTNEAIASSLSMPKRTVRLHTLRFSQLGLVDQAEVFPAHRFKWSEKARNRNSSYLQRLEKAVEIFRG